MDLGLKGKNAVVTGGSQGIGKAIARELAREGVSVAIVARKKDQLEAAARELSAETGGRVIALTADVTSKEQVETMVGQAAAEFGGLHILVNSGSSPGGSTTAIGPIETVVEEDLLLDFNTKYVGALRCARAVIPHLKKQGWGRIINISGTNARNAGNLSGGARNVSRTHGKDPRRAARALRHHGELHSPGHNAHRAHASPAGRTRGRARGYTRGSREANLCAGLPAWKLDLPHGRCGGGRLCCDVPRFGQGMGHKRRARRGDGRGRPVGVLLAERREVNVNPSARRTRLRSMLSGSECISPARARPPRTRAPYGRFNGAGL